MAGSALVLAMLLVFVFTGIGQDPLQYVHATADYTEILLRNPPVLKAAIGMDNAFVLFYSTMFLALAAALWRQGQSKVVVGVAASLMALSGLLDLAENMHFMAMIGLAQQNLGVSAAEIEWQVWESLLKFHVSYVGLFLLSFALPSDTRAEKTLIFLSRWVQWPVGMLIYVAPDSLTRALVFGRFGFFLAAMLLLAAIYRPHANGSGGRA